MLKKTIKFTDYNGNERTEDFYFNLTKAEIIEMEMNESQLARDGGITGGLQEKFDLIKNRGSGREILAAFKDIIFMSVGQKSDDGLYFHKSAAISEKFASSPAYSVLFTEIVTDETAAGDFVKAVLPRDFSEGDRDKPAPGRVPSAPKTITPPAPPVADDIRNENMNEQPTPESMDEFRKWKQSQDQGQNSGHPAE